MPPMNGELEKFQGLLRELFQFDRADLDFGIYRRVRPSAHPVSPERLRNDAPKDADGLISRVANAASFMILCNLTLDGKGALFGLPEAEVELGGADAEVAYSGRRHRACSRFWARP
jgi:hypothetical protein